MCRGMSCLRRSSLIVVMFDERASESTHIYRLAVMRQGDESDAHRSERATAMISAEPEVQDRLNLMCNSDVQRFGFVPKLCTHNARSPTGHVPSPIPGVVPPSMGFRHALDQ